MQPAFDVGRQAADSRMTEAPAFRPDTLTLGDGSDLEHAVVSAATAAPFSAR
jgi:hypothetical protein